MVAIATCCNRYFFLVANAVLAQAYPALTPLPALPYGPRLSQAEPHVVRFILIVSGAPSTDV